MKKVLFALTSNSEMGSSGKKTGAHLGEITHPYEVLSRAGYEIDFVSPRGGSVPLDHVDVGDSSNANCLKDKIFLDKIERSHRPEELSSRDYAAIYYAGGHGTMWDLPNNRDLGRLTSEIYDNGGIVGAVCHGPSGLLNVKLRDGSHLVDGKEISCFTNEEEMKLKLDKVVPFMLQSELENRGAKHKGSPPQQKMVVVSERLVTGQNPASARGVGEEMVKLLKKKA